MIFIILKFVGNNLCHAQGWQFALLLIRSKSLILKSNLTKKRATWVIPSWLERITLKKQAICLKKFLFFVCFSLLFPFLCPRINNCSRRSVSLFKRATHSSLFTKEHLWAIHSFERANRSFAHKKRAIRLKNKRVNSNPGHSEVCWSRSSSF